MVPLLVYGGKPHFSSLVIIFLETTIYFFMNNITISVKNVMIVTWLNHVRNSHEQLRPQVEDIVIQCEECGFILKTIEDLQKHNEKEHVQNTHNLQQIQDENEFELLKERRELEREVKTNERAFKLEKENFEEEKKTIKDEINKENAKVHKDNLAKMIEISEQLSEYREEIKMQVKMNTKFKEENKVLEGIEESQDLLDQVGPG